MREADKLFQKLVIVLFLSQIIVAQNLEYLTYSPSCSSNCLLVNTTVIAFKGGDVYYVGDTFYYDISLKNIGNNTINTTLTVKLIHPTGALIYSQDYPINLSPQNTGYLLASGQASVFKFPSAGTYSIQITSSNPVMFEECISSDYIPSLNCTASSHLNAYVYFFDAMPKWQKDWIDLSTQLLKTQINLSNETVSLTATIANLTNQTQQSNQRAETTNTYMLLITIFTAILATYEFIFKIWPVIVNLIKSFVEYIQNYIKSRELKGKIGKKPRKKPN